MVRRVGAPWAAALALVCAATALPAAAQVPPPSYASFFDRLPCVQRIGRCFDATIGGVPVEEYRLRGGSQLRSMESS